MHKSVAELFVPPGYPSGISGERYTISLCYVILSEIPGSAVWYNYEQLPAGTDTVDARECPNYERPRSNSCMRACARDTRTYPRRAGHIMLERVCSRS